jgi:hypothetical protein
MRNDHAYLVHGARTRLRIKIPGRRHDEAYFSLLRRTLSGRIGIRAVRVNPLTASVLIVHDGTLDWRMLRQPDLGFHLQPAMAASPCSRVPGRAGVTTDAQVNLVSVLTRLALAAMTGRLAAQLLEWCLDAMLQALIDSVIGTPPHVRLAGPTAPAAPAQLPLLSAAA